MDIVNTVKEAVTGAKPDHPHTLTSDIWQQVVHRVGPKIAAMIWEAVPEGARDKTSGWVKEIFSIASIIVAQFLPNKGIGAFFDAMQVEVASELYELAAKHKTHGHIDENKISSSPSKSAVGVSDFGVEGREQILRLELVRVNRIIAWLACATSAKVDPKDILEFLNGLTLRELRSFADLEDMAKQMYIEARIRKSIPKVESKKFFEELVALFGRTWEKVKDCAEKVDADLNEIALDNDNDVRVLEERVASLREDVTKPLGRASWEIWKL